MLAHVSHARAYLPLLPTAPATVVDLGTGGGVPGLPLAVWRPELDIRLVDSMRRRTAFLERAVAELGLASLVVCARAEALGRDPAWRGAIDVVVSRSLAAPGVAAEYIAPFLRPGGYAIVAEPPGGAPDRWDPYGLEVLGMQRGQAVRSPDASLVRLDQIAACPEKFPRRTGVAAKRPLF